jgi:general stress protein 26
MESQGTVTQAQEEQRAWKAKRDRLFEKYLKDPCNTMLAIEIKAIDDLVAKSKEGEAAQRPRKR